jgi:hypothetical protein
MRPHFLVIGGQKCGTSWLQDNLAQHPQIWLPPIKEVHYFDHGNIAFHERLFSTSKRMRKARAYAYTQLRAWAAGRTHDLNWAIRYWLGPRDDVWYCSLFPHKTARISGEICPGYARLTRPAVERVKRLLPAAKIIYLLRNPIERSWSYAAQYFSSPRAKGKYGQLANVPPSELREFLERDAEGHSNYIQALDAWQPHFEGQMLIGFFDELQSAPDALFKRIARFLEVSDDSTVVPGRIRENLHRSRDVPISEEYRSFLSALHLPSLTRLHERLKAPETERWLRAARDSAEGNARSVTCANQFSPL